MNFQQLRIIRENVGRNYNLTEVANALFTSQSGVSKHIKDLEDELGVELFVRRGKRLLGLTGPGEEPIAIVERILLDAQNIKKLVQQFSAKDRGQLSVATTHTQALCFAARFCKIQEAISKRRFRFTRGETGRNRVDVLRSTQLATPCAAEATCAATCTNS